jgi:hypothetical protein
MHRSVRISSILALLLTSVVAAPATVAQDTATPPAGHPLVGAWAVDTNADDPTNPSSRVIFSSDGMLFQVDLSGVAIGAWEPTGERTGALTLTFQTADADGAVSTSTVRATVETTEDGQSWNAGFTVEYIGHDGVSSGQLGPVTATGTRIVVEPMSPAASPGS